jgi:flagellar motor protein MotB
VRLETEPGGLRLRLPIEFAPGAAELPQSAHTALSELAAALAGSGAEVVVEGTTDPRPLRRGARYRSNWELGLARAHSALAALRETDPDADLALLATASTQGSPEERTVIVSVRPRGP